VTKDPTGLVTRSFVYGRIPCRPCPGVCFQQRRPYDGDRDGGDTRTLLRREFPMPKVERRNFNCPETDEPCTNGNCTKGRCHEREQLQIAMAKEAVAKQDRIFMATVREIIKAR
jgi:hypothetical protein